MTNEEAAALLQDGMRRSTLLHEPGSLRVMEAMDMALRALRSPAPNVPEDMREAAARLVETWDHERSLATLADQIRALPIAASPCFVCDGDGVLHAEREGPDGQIVAMSERCPNCEPHQARETLEDVLRRQLLLHYTDTSQSEFIEMKTRSLARECLAAIRGAAVPKPVRDWVYEYDERLVSGHLKEPLIGTVAGLECDLRSWIRQEYGL